MLDIKGNKTTAHKVLVAAVAKLVPDYDVAMHVNAIEQGHYTLAKLTADSEDWYNYDGYTIQGQLMSEM